MDLILEPPAFRHGEIQYKHDELYQEAEIAGCDGIIVKGMLNSGFEGRTLYVVFNESQIRFAMINSIVAECEQKMAEPSRRPKMR